ncbi:CD225/dispanin family protein [Rhodococcus rhodnii]|uniref:Interferon-induced transmembrane protein n=2 Tax=Rhodococcus rhodnii TaxID=38312 RepID=R7WQD0_9NOCA|nr:CD225/dispanin family protein [Rhodococcus rhodnii]EOM76194.1 hypothetical protein Rrhod_2560 [Rhodococcus rhodnii LMG 5362]
MQNYGAGYCYPQYGAEQSAITTQPPIQRTPGTPGVPPRNAGWAVAATLFFWPLAFAAWNHVHDVVPRWLEGNYQAAQYASDRAKKLGKIALLVWALLFVLLIVFYVAIVAVAVSAAVDAPSPTPYRYG